MYGATSCVAVSRLCRFTSRSGVHISLPGLAYVYGYASMRAVSPRGSVAAALFLLERRGRVPRVMCAIIVVLVCCAQLGLVRGDGLYSSARSPSPARQPYVLLCQFAPNPTADTASSPSSLVWLLCHVRACVRARGVCVCHATVPACPRATSAGILSYKSLVCYPRHQNPLQVCS